MSHSETETVEFDGFEWSVASTAGDEDLQQVREQMERIERCRAELAPDDRTWFTIPEKGSDRLFVKVFRHDSFLQRSRYTLFGSQAQTEWNHLLRLYDRDVSVPPPVALGQRTASGQLNACILVTRNLEGRTLRAMLEKQYGTSGWERMRSHLWPALAEVTAQLIDAGFHHRDYHDQNIIVTPDPISGKIDDISIHVTDLHRASFSGNLSARDISSMLAFLLYSLRTTVPLWECRRLYEELKNRNVRLSSLPGWSRLCDDLARRKQEHLTSRIKSCLNGTGEFQTTRIKQHGSWLVHHRQEVDKPVLRNWIRAIQSDKHDFSSSLLKTRSDGRTVRVQFDAGTDLVVKETEATSVVRKIEHLTGRSKPRKSWWNSYGIEIRKLQSPKSMALIEPDSSFSNRSSFYVEKHISDAMQLDDWIRQLADTPDSKGHQSIIQLLMKVSGYIRMIHRKGFFHKDLKANNILFNPAKEKYFGFYLIDLDRMEFYDCPLPENPRIKNLVQLSHALMGLVSWSDLLRAWNKYIDGPTVPFKDPSNTLRTVVNRVRQRD